ncbi:L-arabinose isomerase [Breznakiella homolactica]|uniref:L-arabinose isomerase n=1 Tax=Breznakiella homolactica TaxID=2798577 RepID=A0A7T8BBQ5_9SPIR|nr:L-arabinose isomerase [Breznakiella homolactica]QQO10832.1 L-arabinose isomerase [Breznakiella homolactica]
MFDLKKYEFWFIVGSQDLYGEETLKQVEANVRIMAQDFAGDPLLPGTVVLKPVAITPQVIKRLFAEANASENCAGIITWMHTFSPSKMWIQGLALNHKPILHLHTQFNREIPWDSIDMDFMNLNQAAHGDREHGHIYARMRLNRKIVAGFWKDSDVRRRIGVWMRAAAARLDGTNSVVVRLGDNMREVAVTEGDKVEAQIKFGWQVNTWGIGDLVERYKSVSDGAAENLVKEFADRYAFSPDVQQGGKSRQALLEQVKIEIALKALLEAEHAGAFTTNFQDLHGLPQLPGFAAQRLMEQGYGFGGEGDWKQSMLLHVAKVMASGLPGGVSFMEDYTYHFAPGEEAALGAHMLEVCPSIAGEKPRIEVHPLGIGGKAPPARLVFDAVPGAAVLATIIDMGNRFRMIINEVEGIKISHEMPRLPVARALWKPYPSLTGAAESWILAGGTHHSVYSTALTSEYFRDWAEMMDIECVLIGRETNPDRLREELRWGESYWNSRI